MKTHQDIDRRSLVLARAVAAVIDRDPSRRGLEKARENCARWLQSGGGSCVREWVEILHGTWPEVRAVLLADTELGRRLRQSNPFCGILSPRERWAIYREVHGDERAA